MRFAAAEQRAVDRGIATLGISVGLFDAYGPTQRMYGRRGYIPDGRGACQGHRPLSEGAQVRLDHDVMIWLTKELAIDPSPKARLTSYGSIGRRRSCKRDANVGRSL